MSIITVNQAWVGHTGAMIIASDMSVFTFWRHCDNRLKGGGIYNVNHISIILKQEFVV